MPFMEGDSLRDLVEREGQISVDRALELTLEVAAALGYAHERGVVHRDIKPENILIEADRAVVADFGIAQATTEAGGERLTGTGVSIGTAEYMSPEQASGDRNIDGRSDIYSLGAVLYEMLAGDPPFTGRTRSAIIARVISDDVPSLKVVRKNVQPGVVKAVRRSLEKVPGDRYAMAEQFSQALEAARHEAIPDGSWWERYRRALVDRRGRRGRIGHRIRGMAWWRVHEYGVGSQSRHRIPANRKCGDYTSPGYRRGSRSTDR